MRGDRREKLLQRHERKRADDRAVQAAEPAQDQHQQHVAGLVPRQELGIDESELHRREIAGEPGQRAGDREARKLVAIHRKPERAHALLVAADPLQRAAERRAQQHAQEDEDEEHRREHEIVDVRRIAEVERREAADRRDRLEVHADAVGTAAELRVVEHEVEHLRERERHHDEIDPLHPDDEALRRQAPQAPRATIAAGNVSHRLAASYLGASSPSAYAPTPKIRRVAKRYQSRVADQQVERQREDREDHHLGDELGVERRAGEREQREQRQRRQQRDLLALQAPPPTRIAVASNGDRG